jgi:hypothetical protein
MADKILHHMLYVHEGMEPSVVTMNILEKAAMRSRDKGIMKQWVEGWKKRVSESSQNAGSNLGDGSKEMVVVNEISRLTSELLDIAARYEQNNPELVIVNDNDNYTLSTRIAYLIVAWKTGGGGGCTPCLVAWNKPFAPGIPQFRPF